jgi:S-methylmethionine-dependent homocysteine/selenocysteine methylase
MMSSGSPNINRSVLARWFVGGEEGKEKEEVDEEVPAVNGTTSSSSTTADDDAAGSTTAAAAAAAALRLPRVMILDGGVSTHLAECIVGCGQRFEYKELWSSSLLLTEPGRQQIVRSHRDWLTQAHVDCLSTVTYQ